MTRYNPLKGRFGAWLRQPNDTMEGSYSGIIATMKQYMNGDVFCPKVADGRWWQINSDDHAIGSYDQLKELRDYCYSVDVAICPVVVPRGEDAVGEAAFHASIADVCGCLMVDIEPYPGFWDKSPYQKIDAYCDTLRTKTEAYLVVQPDPRHYGWNDTRMPTNVTKFDGLCPQDYVGADWAQWHNVMAQIANVKARIAQYPQIDHYTTLYGTQSVGEALLFWNSVRDLVQGAHVFALGEIGPREFEAWKAAIRPVVAPNPLPGKEVPVPPRPVPPPNPDIEFLAEAHQWLADDLATEQARWERALAVAEMRSNRIKAITPAMTQGSLFTMDGANHG